MRLPQWTGYALAVGAMLLIGCSANMVGTSPAPVKTAGKVSLFDNPSGYGSLRMRIVDQRQGFGTQAIQQVEGYDEVHIRLFSSKLIEPRFATMSAEPSHQYQSDVLSMLPPASDYSLIVSLASHSVILNSPLLVGEGAQENIQVLPGSSEAVTVIINSVGEIEFMSEDYRVSAGSQEISENHQILGFPELLSNTNVMLGTFFPDNQEVPESQRIHRVRLQLTDQVGNILLDPEGLLLATDSMYVDVDSEGQLDTAMTGFTVPLIADNEKLAWLTLYGFNVYRDWATEELRERLISTKTRGILMLKGATLSVDVIP